MQEAATPFHWAMCRRAGKEMIGRARGASCATLGSPLTQALLRLYRHVSVSVKKKRRTTSEDGRKRVNRSMRTAVAAVLAIGFAVAGADSVRAAEYPSQAVRIVVPFGAGDAIDGTARVLADRLKQEFKVPVVVQNIPGAGGSQGALEAARAAADGYTLLMGSTGALTAGPLIRDAGYKTDDFVAVAQLAESPIGLAVRAESPYKSVKDIVEAAKKDPGSVTYSTPAPGSTQHINMEEFAKAQGIKLTHIGGQGGKGSVTKALTGEVVFAFVGASNYTSLAEAGKIRVLGVAAPKRVSYLPKAPTFREQGYDLDAEVWFGIVARKETPRPVIERLANAIAAVAKDSKTKAMYEKFHLSDAYLDAAAFQKRIDATVASNRATLKDIGLAK
jgi:tripartite-type tricarboxylate transporter receptor subunit TctC